MNARNTAAVAETKQPPRRRWRKILGAFAIIVIVVLLAAWYFLQPARLTALILDRASRMLQVELETTGPGSYALRPEPRLVLPGLSARLPGEKTPFFRSARVELALPWATLRGKSTDISSIVLASPDVDLAGMRGWLATQPARTTPFKLPTLTRGLHASDGVLRGTSWRIEHLDLDLPSLADGKAAQLDANGALVRGTIASKFDLNFAAKPAGMGMGLRVDDAHIALKSDGELPSLTASGSLQAADSSALDLHGAFQRIPAVWTAAMDSSYAHPGATPFAITLSDAPAQGALELTATRRQQRLHVSIGDAKRQPALALEASADRGDLLDAKLHAELSRWPDAWPALPAELTAGAAAMVFDASYRGTLLMEAPIAFDLKRVAASLQGNVRVADLRQWLRNDHAGALPPVEATLSLPQIESDGVQLRGVRMRIRADEATQQTVAPTPKS